jgi:hypothetical protein
VNGAGSAISSYVEEFEDYLVLQMTKFQKLIPDSNTKFEMPV